MGNSFGRREFACHFKSVSHIFSHTRAPQGVRLLRQWLKNINHQTEPALTRKGLFQRLGRLVAD
jgi:DNA mismatch repair ATPase MutS